MQVPPTRLAELERVIDLDPHAVGVHNAVWTTRLLAEYLARVTSFGLGGLARRLVRLAACAGSASRPLSALNRGEL